MTRNLRRTFGLFLALLAVVTQLTTAVAMAAPTSVLAEATVLCHQDDESNAPAPQLPGHQSPDCPLCVFCHNLAGPAGLITASSILPAPASVAIDRPAVLPPATAPPVHRGFVSYPRAPPIPA